MVTRDDLVDPQYVAQLKRMVAGPRRPEDVPLAREYFQLNLALNAQDAASRRHRDFVSAADVTLLYGADNRVMTRAWLDTLEVGRDRYLYHLCNQADTMLIYTGPQFCDLLAATQHPTVVDLSVLARIGNHTAIITYARNMDTGVPGNALATMVLHTTTILNDGKRHLVGAMIHEDTSISSFMYTLDEIGPDLASVVWATAFNERSCDLTGEQRLLSNTLALLGAQQVATSTPWHHYPKAARTDARVMHRKLPPVNVVTLNAPVQAHLNEHTAATAHGGRDGWWPQRGFFRLQRVGPGRVNRRLTYVHPCRKGNLDGPMIGRPQVRQSA